MAANKKVDPTLLKLDLPNRSRGASISVDEAQRQLFRLTTPRDIRKGSEYEIKKPETAFDLMEKAELKKELEIALRNLEETENELKLAAEIGVSLVEKGKEDEEKIKQDEEKIKHLKQQLEMLTQNDSKFNEIELDRQQEESETHKKINELTAENKAIIQKNELLRSQLEEAANANESLQQLLEEKERKLDKLQIEHSTLITAGMQNKKTPE